MSTKSENKINTQTINNIQTLLKTYPIGWLFLGILLVVISQFRYQLGFLVWLMPVPFIHYLRLTGGWKSRIYFIVAMMSAWSLATLKILTEPLPPAMAPLFGVPIGLFHGLPYLIFDGIKKRLDDGVLSSLLFASLITISEWSMHTLTPLGSWGSAAYTQLDYLPILQFASIGGLAGIAFVIYLASAVIETTFSLGLQASKPPIILAAGLILGVIIFGTLRLTLSSNRADETVLAAAVGTDLELKPNSPLPSTQELNQIEKALFDRTAIAQKAGAKLVVWNEGGFVQHPKTEADFLKRASKAAASRHLELVVAYVVVLNAEPLKFENKYVWFRPDGSIHHQYLKRIPVPGEPAVSGKGPMQTVDSRFGKLSGAICYDYDFPKLGKEHADQNVDIVVIPSNDWRGIDPIHTQMATIRGIEGGHSILRSTALGLSAGADAYGRIRGYQSSFDKTQKIMFARLPQKGFTTVYGLLGDWVVLLSGVLIAFSLLQITVFKKKARIKS